MSQRKSGSGLRICVVGYGSIGRRHARNAKALGAEVFVYRSGKQQSKAPGEDSDIETYYDYDEALASGPDAVLVCNPTSMHMETALAAARQGVHLFIEKPVSHSLAMAGELGNAIDANNVVCSVGYMMRLDPLIKQLKEMIDSGRLGPVRSAHLEWGSYMPSWHPWEDYRQSYTARKDLGGGVVLTCSHEIDLARFLLGEIGNVCAMGGQQTSLELDVDDSVDILNKHAGGTISHIHLDFFQRPGHRRIRVVGEEAAAEWDFHKRYLTVEGAAGVVHEAALPDDFDFNQVYVDMLDDFFLVLGGEKEKVCCDYPDGVGTLKASLAALDSLSCDTRITLG